MVSIISSRLSRPTLIKKICKGCYGWWRGHGVMEEPLPSEMVSQKED